MGLRLIRQESKTPNVSNHDDVRMVRYAYGGYDGFVKNRGQEIGHAVSGTSFVVQSGVINLQGWEVEIDANGVSIPTSASVTNKTYYSVYLEVNCATDTAEIKSLTDPAGYPEISESDDLTQNTIGTARLLLYHFTATSGVISNVEKAVKEIEYAGAALETLQEGLEEGTIKPADSKKVNGLELERDENGILNINGTIISQKRLLWEGDQECSQQAFGTFNFNYDIKIGSMIEIHAKRAAHNGSSTDWNKMIFKICTMGLDGQYYPYVLAGCIQPNSATWDVYTLGQVNEIMENGMTVGIKIGGIRMMRLYETPRIEEDPIECNIERIYEVIE